MPKRFQRSQSADTSGVKVFAEVSQEGEECEDVLTQAALDEIRQLKNPPLAVRRTLEVMHIVLNARRHSRGLPTQGIRWENVLRTLAADDLAEQLETYDISQLRQFPDLARDLHDFYFEEGLCFNRHKSRCSRKLQTAKSSFLRRAVTSEELKLSPGRVRYASRAAATLFAWAAKAVAEALPPPTPPTPPMPEPTVVADEVEVLPELLLPGEPDPPAEALTAGVWATCPQGHGLCVGIAGTPVCAVCGNTILRGGDSASCRLCGFFVCVGCRKGSWLSIAGASASSAAAVQVDIVAMRFLRDGEELPAALAALAPAANVPQMPGTAAVWGGEQQLEEVQLTFHNDLLKEGVSQVPMSCVVQSAPKAPPAPPVPPRSGSGVFGLMDTKALNASILCSGWMIASLKRPRCLLHRLALFCIFCPRHWARGVQVVLQPKITQAQGKLEAAFLSQLEHVHSLVDAVNDRMASVEKDFQQSRARYIGQMDLEASAIEQDLAEFRKAFELEQVNRQEREHGLQERLEAAKLQTAEKLARDDQLADRKYAQLLRDADESVRERDREQQKFKEQVDAEIASLKTAISEATQARSQADDDIVAALNHYTKELQQAVSSVSHGALQAAMRS
ncbi:unnamed protein product [Symbiodinium natans]|uniref:Uncharacterized protein n=1 Tax=Symbiodinium natans TaxID=878477 RepID=A0A812SHH7_9DINO|nr:unnamed protein product [Symbiodinium natans]